MGRPLLLSSAAISGTSFWQCGHQWATSITTLGLPDDGMVMALPSNRWPVTVGAVLPMAGSAPIGWPLASAGCSGRFSPVTVTVPKAS